MKPGPVFWYRGEYPMGVQRVKGEQRTVKKFFFIVVYKNRLILTEVAPQRSRLLAKAPLSGRPAAAGTIVFAWDKVADFDWWKVRGVNPVGNVTILQFYS